MDHQSKKLIDEIDSYLHQLFPITRSITGPGNRETLRILQEICPLVLKEYPSGTSVYDWVIPDEWHPREAWIKDRDGQILIDFRECNLHLVSYSEPIHQYFEFDELKGHLHYDLELPESIPYRTSYYKRDWGFCVNEAQYTALSLANAPLEVMIDTELNSNGSMTIGELLIPGKLEQEILISTYICHPSLANDNLSGVVMTAFLARDLLEIGDLTRSYRIIWAPETIGAIAYSAMNEDAIKRINSGLVVTTVAGRGKYGYKQSFDLSHSVNVAIEEVFEEEGIDFITYPFSVHGSDERQYSSQGFRINVASLTKDKYYEYPQYHSSLDNLAYVSGKTIAESLNLYSTVLDKLNHEIVYRNRFPYCEAMLSQHDLYPELGGQQVPGSNNLTELDLMLWLLWLCDGSIGLIQLEKQLGVSQKELIVIADRLCAKGLLERVA
tara:strand:- start:1167 stop:2483 length:1317 start_codon:yes stop_codon:yes gene_type:complete